MINFYFVDLAKVVLAFLLALLQSGASMASAHSAMLNVGDHIDGMTLTTGAAEARPLWVYCSSEVNMNVTTAECRVPKLSKLAIGHVFFSTDSAFQGADWSSLHWELYLDDQYINLEKFGTYDYLLPTMAPNPSLVREVFMKFTAWDVVLADLQPGVHTLEGRVFDSVEEYRWIVNLTIDEATPSQWASPQQGRKFGHVRSLCPETGPWLSRFHGSCKLYA